MTPSTRSATPATLVGRTLIRGGLSVSSPDHRGAVELDHAQRVHRTRLARSDQLLAGGLLGSGAERRYTLGVELEGFRCLGDAVSEPDAQQSVDPDDEVAEAALEDVGHPRAPARTRPP